MRTKKTSEELVIFKKIDEILYFDWNPIGDGELPKNEYTSYVPEIFWLKKTGASIEEIAQALYRIETVIMEMGGTLENCRSIAKKIHDL